MLTLSPSEGARLPQTRLHGRFGALRDRLEYICALLRDFDVQMQLV